MTTSLARWALLVWCSVVWGAAALAAEGPALAETVTGQTPASRFIALSDMHFDPTATRSIMPLLIASEPEQWAAILDAHGPTDAGHFGEDTNWTLLRSALDQMRSVEPSPAFLIVTGDFLASLEGSIQSGRRRPGGGRPGRLSKVRPEDVRLCRA